MKQTRNRIATWLLLAATLPGADLPGQSEDQLGLTEACGPPGETVEVYVLADNVDPLGGLEVSLYLQDGLDIEAVDVEFCDLPASARLYGPVHGDGCINFGIVMDLSSDNLVLPPGKGHKVARLLVRTPESAVAGQEYILETADGCGIQQVRNLFAVSEGPYIHKAYPELSAGTVCITEPGDCDGDGIPDFEEDDCNDNNIPDECEVERFPSRDVNADGVLDECAPRQLPGNCNQDGVVDLSDAICLLGHLFLGSPDRLPCGEGNVTDPGNRSLLDFNDDAGLDVSDAIHLLSWLFLGGSSAHPLGTECVPVAGCGASVACD